MDLPPPYFDRPEHRRDRYGNTLIHHRDFPPSPPFTHHLPPPPPLPPHHLPPPPPLPPHLLPPPSPPPPPPPHHHHHFAYSPPRHYYEIDPTPKPLFDRNHDAFRPQRDSLPFRLRNEFYERSPRFRDDSYEYRGYSGDFIDSMRLDSGGRAREGCSMVSDVGAAERFGRGLYDDWEDGEVRRDNFNDYRGRDMYDERDYVDLKLNSRRHERFGAERRWDNDFDEAGGYDLRSVRNDDLRVRGYGIDHSSREFYDERDGYRRRQGYERDANAIGIGRFSGRLGSRVSNEKVKRDVKKRGAQKIRAFDRIDREKSCKRRKSGHQFQHAPKETNSSIQFQRAPRETTNSTSTRGGQEREIVKRLEIGTEKKKEREQSPLDLAISFESNGLVARAILSPSSPAGKSSTGLTPGNNSDEVTITTVAQTAISSKEMFETDVLTCELDTQYDARGISEELLEKSNASVELNVSSGSPSAKSSEDTVGTVVTHGLDTRFDANGNSTDHLDKPSASGEMNSTSGSLLYKSSEDMVAPDVVAAGLDIQFHAHGALEVLLEKSNASENGSLKISDANDSGSNALVNEKNLEDLKAAGLIEVGSRQTSMVRKKKKAKKKCVRRITEEHLEPSLVREKDNGSTEVPCDLAINAIDNESPEKLNSRDTHHTVAKRAKRSRARKLRKIRKAKKKILQGSSLEAIKDSDKKTKHNIDVPSGPKCTTFDDENVGESSIFCPHSDDVDICGFDPFTSMCSDRVNDLMHPPIQRTVCCPSPDEPVSCSAPEANCSQLEKAENVKASDLGSADDYSKKMEVNHEDAFRVTENTAAGRVCSSAVVSDCLNVELGSGTNSKFLSVEHKVITAESDTSILDDVMNHSLEDGANLSHENCPVDGSLAVTSGMETWICQDHSPNVLRKRKASDDQNDISCEENGSSSEGPFGLEDLSLDVSYVDVCFFKKKKIDSSNLTSVSMDGAPVLSEQKAGLQEDAHTAVSDSMNICGAINMEENVGEEGYSIPDVDVISTHQENLSVNDHATSLEILSSDKNVGCISSSGNDMIESESDEPSCPSSPEDLLLFSDFSSPFSAEPTPSQSRNGMVYGTEGTFNRKPMSFSLQNSSHNATSKYVRTSTVTQPLTSQVTRPIVQKSNLVHGKFTMSRNQPTSAIPNAFPTYPKNSNSTAKALTIQATKSRKWCRTGSTSVPVTTPNSQPCLLPQGRATKIPRNNPSSYVRAGNSLVRTSPSCATSPAFNTISSSRPGPGIDGLKKDQVSKSGVEGNHAPSPLRKSSPPSVISSGFHALSSSVYKRSPSIDGLKKSLEPKSSVGGINAPSLQRKSPHAATSHGFNSLVYRLDNSKKAETSKNMVTSADATSLQRMQPVNTSTRPESPSLSLTGKLPNSTSCNSGESLPVSNTPGSGCSRNLGILQDTMQSLAIPECQNGSGNNSDSQSTLDYGNSGKKILYVKRGSNQLVATSNFEGTSVPGKDRTRPSDGYYKSRGNQLLRTSLENHLTKRDASVDVNFRLGSQVPLPKSSSKRQLVKGFSKTSRSSKLSLVWKLHEDVQSSEKHKISQRPQKVLSRLFPWKRATYRRNFMLALGSRPTNKTFTKTSQKLLLTRKRGAVYTRSSHGYSLRMSKVFSVGGSSLKWSKSMEKDSKKANEEATRAVAALEKRKKEQKTTIPIVSKARNSVSRERIFRIGSERYKMDPTRRTLHRITAEENPSTSVSLPPDRVVKKSYIPKRLFIGNNEYVRIGNGNQLVRDPKKRTRVLASEKVRWSLRTARMRWAKKKKYCQFFTKFGKCNKDDGKCPYIHDSSKIVVCTKFLNGSCSNPDCKLTHKIIPERMQDCSYFLKGSCSNENCPYRHVTVDPDSPVCESFLRGYCADGNECRKKHTYVCPAYEASGICPQAATCKLHHPKKKTEKKSTSEEKIVRGRYFDGGLIGLTDYSIDASEEVSEKGMDDKVCREGKYPDYISLEVSGDEMGHDLGSLEQAC